MGRIEKVQFLKRLCGLLKKSVGHIHDYETNSFAKYALNIFKKSVGHIHDYETKSFTKYALNIFQSSLIDILKIKTDNPHLIFYNLLFTVS